MLFADFHDFKQRQKTDRPLKFFRFTIPTVLYFTAITTNRMKIKTKLKTLESLFPPISDRWAGSSFRPSPEKTSG